MRALPAGCEARTPNQLAATLSKTQTPTTKKTSATSTLTTATDTDAAADTDTHTCTHSHTHTTEATTTARQCSTIQSLFIVIIWRKVLQAVANCLRYAGRIIANANNHENAYTYVNTVVGHDHDVNVVAVRHQQTYPHTYPLTTYAEDDANDKVSTAREQQQQKQLQHQEQRQQQRQHQQQLHLSSSSLQKSGHCMTASTTTKAIMLPGQADRSGLPLITLLIAMLLSMRLTSGK